MTCSHNQGSDDFFWTGNQPGNQHSGPNSHAQPLCFQKIIIFRYCTGELDLLWGLCFSKSMRPLCTSPEMEAHAFVFSLLCGDPFHRHNILSQHPHRVLLVQHDYYFGESAKLFLSGSLFLGVTRISTLGTHMNTLVYIYQVWPSFISTLASKKAHPYFWSGRSCALF